jgi:Fe2+ or Zn2+ uptake regulation protein
MRIIPEMRAGRAAHDPRPADVESAEAALRDRGFRLTAPRHAVLEVVRAIKTHPTAEEVHRLVIRRAPGVSLGTVYRNLRLLGDAGLLGELPGPRARFDASTRAHHHFTCLRCGRIADVEAPVAEPQSRALSSSAADPVLARRIRPRGERQEATVTGNEHSESARKERGRDA